MSNYLNTLGVKKLLKASALKRVWDLPMVKKGAKARAKRVFKL